MKPQTSTVVVKIYILDHLPFLLVVVSGFHHHFVQRGLMGKCAGGPSSKALSMLAGTMQRMKVSRVGGTVETSKKPSLSSLSLMKQ